MSGNGPRTRGASILPWPRERQHLGAPIAAVTIGLRLPVAGVSPTADPNETIVTGGYRAS